MEWELKAELVKLANSRRSNTESEKEFKDFVLKNVSTFDLQSWDMFATITDFIIDEMKADIDYWREIYKYLQNIDCNDFGMRLGMRIAMMQTICEDELGFKEAELS